MSELWIRSEVVEEDSGKSVRRFELWRISDMEVKFFELKSEWVRESYEALAEVDRAFENELAEIREGFEEGDQFILLFRFIGVSNEV